MLQVFRSDGILFHRLADLIKNEFLKYCCLRFVKKLKLFSILCYILLEMNQNHKNICNSMQVIIVSIISIISSFNILSAKK